jgi:hypothetical protein
LAGCRRRRVEVGNNTKLKDVVTSLRKSERIGIEVSQL